MDLFSEVNILIVSVDVLMVGIGISGKNSVRLFASDLGDRPFCLPSR